MLLETDVGLEFCRAAPAARRLNKLEQLPIAQPRATRHPRKMGHWLGENATFLFGHRGGEGFVEWSWAEKTPDAATSMCENPLDETTGAIQHPSLSRGAGQGLDCQTKAKRPEWLLSYHTPPHFAQCLLLGHLQA